MREFLGDCLDGSVYDRVMELTGFTRDEVKTKFLAVIYGHPDDMGTRVGGAIRRLYPAVFDAVAELNGRGGRGALPRLMQTMESDVMIRRVAARLLREHPDMPLLTVHDSVLVPEEDVGAAQRVIAEEWRDEFGLEPRVKTSAFTDPQGPREKKPKKKCNERRPWRRDWLRGPALSAAAFRRDLGQVD